MKWLKFGCKFPSKWLSFQSQSTDTSRRVSFTPMVDGPVEISLFEVGADSDYQVGIKSANKGTIKNGKLQIKAVKSQRESIDLFLTDGFTGAIKVVGHEI